MSFIFFKKFVKAFKSLVVLVAMLGCRNDASLLGMHSDPNNDPVSNEASMVPLHFFDNGGIIVPSSEEERDIEENSEENGCENQIVALPNPHFIIEACKQKIIDYVSFNPIKSKTNVVLHNFYIQKYVKEKCTRADIIEKISKEIYSGEYYYPVFSNSEKIGKASIEDIEFMIFPLESDRGLLSMDSLNDNRVFASVFWKYLSSIIAVDYKFKDFLYSLCRGVFIFEKCCN